MSAMKELDELDRRVVDATKKRVRAEVAFNSADADLRELLREARAAGKGPSHLARLTGFTREWVAKIAPDPKRARDASAARNIAES
ncbi:MAG: hypothetical protein GX542_08370 [Rhodococcus sp.]|nr:hypothetical protein [Rhodococcus sp. (in: high G+C Gram-positive bacteria)]